MWGAYLGRGLDKDVGLGHVLALGSGEVTGGPGRQRRVLGEISLLVPLAPWQLGASLNTAPCVHCMDNIYSSMAGIDGSGFQLSKLKLKERTDL